MERENADDLNRLGRVRLQSGDPATAIALQRVVLRIAPAHPRASGDLRAAEASIADRAGAQRKLELLVAAWPDLDVHERRPDALEPFEGIDDAERAARDVLALDPSLARAHAVLGNVRARRQQRLAAIDAYRLAAMLDWEWAEVHLALSALFESVRDDESADRHRREALARKTLYEAPAGAPRPSVLVLMAPGGATANAPLDFIVDPRRIALHRYYLTGGTPPPAVPEHDAVFCAIEEAESAAPAIERAARFAEGRAVAVLNDPRRLTRLRRSTLPETLRGIAGCRVPPVRRIGRSELEAVVVDEPLVVRPVDTQRGDAQERVATTAELRDYLRRTPGTNFNVSPFVDYRSADGYYRKYRVVVAGGRPYAYHLAVSDAWKVHYHSSLMHDDAALRDEEARFLDAPHAVFPGWNTTFPTIAAALGLDYFGIDCGVDEAGNVLVFECGTGMLVHGRDEPERFAYKKPAVARIAAALEALFAGGATTPKRA